ncbi:MAG: S-methyl-5-thioribose-1-phosphate isomerase [Planctomycetaceae bacterium]|nr:S-methyl-5-thioribose-1-phosphate isomerase [Planctomycetaceae bacterium]
MTVPYFTLQWRGDAATGALWLIDQTKLPEAYEELCCTTAEIVFEAIRSLRVRGAPAIGVAAAYGVLTGTQALRSSPPDLFRQKLRSVAEYLASSRPTAVNLFWALDRMTGFADRQPSSLTSAELHDRLLVEAKAIDDEDKAMCLAIGHHGSLLLEDGMSVLTHCNAGGLATAGDGTALSVIFAAVRAGKKIHVFADETRPLLQGARLTAWELMKRQIPVTVICDNMAAQVMKEGRVHCVVTGADRIAANGDAANKIGTYGVAVLAKYHGVPFYVAAPSSTFDLSLADGSGIPIEQRKDEEIAESFGKRTVPRGVSVYNPAFDVTPASLIDALITEKGVVRNPTKESVAKHFV